MIDHDRLLPSPSASAWSIDLAEVDGPNFIVLCRGQGEARAALVRHLVEIGAISNTIESERVVDAAPIEPVAVVW